MCNIGILFSVAGVCRAESITLIIEHQIDDVVLEEGQYFDGVLYVWAPDSDIDQPLIFKFDGDTEIELELESPGRYFFTAQTVGYNADGTVAVDSDESDSVDYEVIEQADTIPTDSDRDVGGSDENGCGEDPNLDRVPDDPGHTEDDKEDGAGSNQDRSGNASIVAASLGGSPCGCFVGSIFTQ